jgi:hypothetical protein
VRHLCEWTTLAENRWAHVGRKLTNGSHQADEAVYRSGKHACPRAGGLSAAPLGGLPSLLSNAFAKEGQ